MQTRVDKVLEAKGEANADAAANKSHRGEHYARFPKAVKRPIAHKKQHSPGTRLRFQYADPENLVYAHAIHVLERYNN